MLDGLQSFAQVGVSLLVGAVVFAIVVHLLRGLLTPPAPRSQQTLEPHR
jgi:hypothetical protein